MTTVDSVFKSPELTEWAVKLERDLDQISRMLNQLQMERYNSKIDSALTDFRKGAEHFRNTVQYLEGDLSRLELSARADTLFGNMNRLIDRSTGLVNQSQYSIAQVIQHLETTVNELNTSIEQLNSLMMTLSAKSWSTARTISMSSAAGNSKRFLFHLKAMTN